MDKTLAAIGEFQRQKRRIVGRLNGATVLMKTLHIISQMRGHTSNVAIEPARQIDEMRAWYAKWFDAIPGTRSKFKAADLPGVNLTWNPADKPTIPTKGRFVDHIGFEVRNLEAFCKKLEAGGIKLDTPVTKVPGLGLTVAFLTDPWGTRIELTEGLTKF